MLNNPVHPDVRIGIQPDQRFLTDFYPPDIGFIHKRLDNKTIREHEQRITRGHSLARINTAYNNLPIHRSNDCCFFIHILPVALFTFSLQLGGIKQRRPFGRTEHGKYRTFLHQPPFLNKNLLNPSSDR